MTDHDPRIDRLAERLDRLAETQDDLTGIVREIFDRFNDIDKANKRITTAMVGISAAADSVSSLPTDDTEDDLENARVQLESNGHEVAIAFDNVQHERTGRGWYAYCHCATSALDNGDDDYVATEEEARQVGQRHVEEAGDRLADHLRGDPLWADD